MQKRKKNTTGYVVMGVVLILTIIAFVGIRINNKQNGGNNSEGETESRTRKLATWEKYLYADVEDPTYGEVIYEDGYNISFEGFKKYQVGKLGDTINYVEPHISLGGVKDDIKYIKQNIKVLSVNIYDNEEELEASVEEGEKLYKIKGDEDLREGSKYIELEISIGNTSSKDNVIQNRLFAMYIATDKYAAERNTNIGSYDNDNFYPTRYIYMNDIVLCKHHEISGIEGFNFLPIDKDKELYDSGTWLMVPANGSVTIKQIFPVPEKYINSDKLVFATQLNGDGGTYRSAQFCIFVNKK